MPAIQTTYANRISAAVEGAVANMETGNSITRTCEVAIGFGRPVVQGAADRGVVMPLVQVLAASSAAAAGNVGNGTITASPAAVAPALAGAYRLYNVGKDTNAGTFEMEDPNGVVIGSVTAGVAATIGGIGPFTIADGSTDWDEGDAFIITVTATAGGGAFRGITIRDVTLVAQPGETVDLYQIGDDAALLTAGVIFVKLGGTVLAGAQAYWNPSTQRWVSTATAGYYAAPNVTFDASGANGDIVPLRVSHL